MAQDTTPKTSSTSIRRLAPHSPLLNLPITKTIAAARAAQQHSSSTKNNFASLPPPKIITTTDPHANKNHLEPETDAELATTNVHGYIACSSVNNAIEINLRFPKCKCPAVVINGETPKKSTAEADEEIKTKIINFDRNNLCNIVNNLDINTCTKCSISLDVKRLLTRIFSNPALNSDNLNGSCLGDGASLLSASISPRLSESNVSNTAEHDDFIIFNLNKQNHGAKRHSADKRSTGTQHEPDNRSPNSRGSSKNKEVYVITDEFKKKCTEHHIIVKRNAANKAKKKPFSRSLENLSTPEVQRREFVAASNASAVKCDLDLTQNSSQNVANGSNPKRNGKISETKTRSKSVDDISTSSNEVLEGVDSVELIFISDEFLNKSNKEEPEVIIVDPSPRPTPSPNSQSGDEKLSKPSSRKSSQKSDKSPKDKKLYVISDDYKKRSLNNTVIVVKQRETKKSKAATTKTSGNSDVNNAKNVDEKLALNLKKTTTTNSNTFLTYEEPFSPIYDLEDKEIP
ncbi:uncharacterized protein LOC134838331 [Culicoides brevitarsis]|uniref:uncharacterized protein LOC134838331 n=1 Tax=Culicoides brevitarsis TaxID=469753 RepID=UPI00307BEEF1